MARKTDRSENSDPYVEDNPLPAETLDALREAEKTLADDTGREYDSAEEMFKAMGIHV